MRQCSTPVLGIACRYWYLSQFSVKSPSNEGGPQHIVIINHPGHYMKTSELELPLHLYTETKSQCGTMTKYIFAPDKLDAWESDRILQLEDEWMTAGNDEDMHGHKYVNVKHYHTTREDVARDAELKRAGARERMTEHQNAIEKLVQEARVFLMAHESHQEEDSLLPYLITLGAIAAVAYVLVT